MIVVDMDMPENCAECPCGFIYVVEYTIKHCCAVIDKNIDDENIKPPWCPIVGEIEPQESEE